MNPITLRVDPSSVAEIQGLYGPFTFSEKLLQKIWSRGDFDRSRAITTDGRRVRIAMPGRWNLLGGPDFSQARVKIGAEPEITGDVELHLHAVDWTAHGHAHDRAYAGVVLHVVLFPPSAGHVTRAGDGREIPTLVLLPLLHHDLEEYAAEEAVEVLANRPASKIMEKLGAHPPGEIAQVLRHHARERWRQKVHFARLRINRLGWTQACHQTVLEILGYRFNRAPMLRLACRYPLEEWSGVDVDALLETERETWSVQGVRPANQPRTRLNQYAVWIASCPRWPERVAEQAELLPTVDAEAPAIEVRRAANFTAWRARIADEWAGGAITGTRLDTLICDGFLPLIAARAGKHESGLWFHWFPGDLPAANLRSLRALGVTGGRTAPAAHGFAQGLLGWLLEEENR